MNDRLPGTTWDNPVWHKGFRIYLSDFMFDGMQYEYVHDDYDGAPDAGDNRCGHAPSIDAAKAEIDEAYFCPDCDRPNTSCTCPPTCDVCELPEPVCACDDAKAYDDAET